MIDKNNGNVLKVFSSVMDSAKYIVDNNYSTSKDPTGVKPHIRDCASGKRKTAYGFIWKWI